MLRMKQVQKITLHHTNSNPFYPYSIKERLISLAEFHTQDRGWGDIGYHYLVSGKGEIFEGRSKFFQGAHVESFNDANIGVAVIGDFNIEKVSNQLKVSLTILLTELIAEYKLERTDVLGHREYLDKLPGSCPGDFLFKFLKGFRDE
ncbi:N-acetylmuramoyl-L-alanine amidase [Candidatus Dependentiae bacterium]|nr:N-acetylmuramoyl-L-alanine amidase [Candidatus Dependentiae bacterium]